MTLQSQKHFTTIALLCGFMGCTATALYSVQAQEPKEKEQKNVQQKGQSDTRSETLIRLATELVQIDLVVTGKDGKLVRDLRREDFELYEDGRKQQITHFAAGTATRPATWLKVNKKTPSDENNASVTASEVSAGRYIVIAVDDFHLAPENLLNARRVLNRFISEQMVAGDQVAVVTTSGSIGLFQQFTSDRMVLERAINRLSAQNRTATESFDIPRMTDYQAELIDRNDPDALELAIQEILRTQMQMSPPPPTRGVGGGAGGGASLREQAAAIAKMKARSIVALNANYTRVTLETLDGIIRSLRPLTGRKLLVLLSDGFYLGGNSDSQTFNINRVTDAATRSGVVIYSIDARGLMAMPPGGSASEPSRVEISLPGVSERMDHGSIEAKRDGINALARDTGGFLVINNNDLNAGIQKVLNDNEYYYVLAYEPPESRRDGRFHKIEVRIADRSELKVRTRKGYLAPTEKSEKPFPKTAEKPKSPEKIAQETKAVKESQIKTGLASLFPLRDIPVDVAIEYFDTPERGSTIMINAHIDASGLVFQQRDGNHTDALDFVVAIFDEKGKVAHSFSERFKINLKPGELEHIVNRGLSYRRAIPLKPGFYQARIALREEATARLGSAFSWVEVPDLSRKQLTLSSIMLSTGGDGLSAGSAAEGYEPKPSTPRRRFKRGSKVDFLVFAYNARADQGAPDVVIQSQVYSGSKLVYASPLAKMFSRAETEVQRLPYAARVSLEGFDPGEYELRLVAIDRSTKTTAYRRVNFTVE